MINNVDLRNIRFTGTRANVGQSEQEIIVFTDTQLFIYFVSDKLSSWPTVCSLTKKSVKVNQWSQLTQAL